ncbi:MAG: threonylcarbamoyl-AMP synthase [Verrucomicrobia bacterium]|nr:threonylcarbamoyl-AMP synthase [Verrucomicrobiota bacterium]MCH8527963.1 threonylcarbamoyl-AMP synthase [Kiritimatiellia bacterium]
MKHWFPNENDFEEAVEALRRGQLMGWPTETVYGLAGNALDADAVASIFEAKGRPTFDPLIVHAADTAAAFALADSVPPEARDLAERFWPGPLTLVLPRRPDLPDLLSAGLNTLAVRVPSHPVAREVLVRSGLPLAAPSANRFGRISPTCAEHVLEEMRGQPRVAGVMDAGPCALGVESTVVGFPGRGRVVVYRTGGLPVEKLRGAVPALEVVDVRRAEDDPELAVRGEQSPGMLARHYAPSTPLRLLEAGETPAVSVGRRGWLCFSERPEVEGPVEVLSKQGDLAEAATRLFACLRRLDAAGVDEIIAWKVPNQGLGRAINDRLSRAAF